MKTCLCRTTAGKSLTTGILAILFSVVSFDLSSAEIRLKNGTTLRGNLLISNSLSARFVGKPETERVEDKDVTVRSIGRIDNGWQRTHFPVQQDSNQKTGLVGANPTVIPMPRPKRQAGNLTVTQFGSITFIDPFDEYGRRRLTIATAKGPMNVFQSITEAAPDHVMIESTNCDWKMGLPLKSIPIETLDSILRRQVKKEDPDARFAFARFYMQAEYFPQAFNELDALKADFPDKQQLVETRKADLMNYFGKEILRRLGRRKRAGQHQLAESFAKKLLTQPLTGPVQQDVQKYVQSYEESRQAIERAKLLLADWQAKLSNNDQVERLQRLRSEINEQLDFETLPRLDAFLKAEVDDQYEPDQRLGLAYSGWVLGPAYAVPDLDQALRVWDARQMVLDYLRTDDPGLQNELIKKLRSLENISPDKVLLNLIAQLPPLLDASSYEPCVAARVETASDPQTSYWVKLPAEYSPHHSYPMIVALRPAHRSTEQTLSAWAGDINDPDLGGQRGYIVIAPEYAEKNPNEYTFGALAHKYVLDCLIDARKRFAVDSDKVFLAGHGMGADAAFDIGFAHPDEFAGVLPIGGDAINYCPYLWENGSYTAWYVIGKGYDSNGGRNDKGDRVFDRMMQRGFKFDFMLVEYLGRNGENVADEIPKLFDWMDLPLHVRPAPPKQMKMTSLRKSDNRFFWCTASGLPQDYILPSPSGEGQKVTPMVIEASILEPGNIITLKSPTKNYVLRLTPELVDFGKPVVVRIGGHVEFREFVTPDANVLLDELRLRGDRKRLPLAVIMP